MFLEISYIYLSMEHRIEIPLSKKKLLYFLAVSVTFMMMGIAFAVKPEIFTSPLYKNPGTIRIIGIACASISCLGVIYFGTKLFDDKAGLTINSQGIIDNTHAMSTGLIAWNDITAIETLKDGPVKILVLYTDYPEKYIGRAKNALVKSLMKANYQAHGSPLSLTSGSLRIKFEELEQLVISEFKKQR